MATSAWYFENMLYILHDTNVNYDNSEYCGWVRNINCNTFTPAFNQYSPIKYIRSVITRHLSVWYIQVGHSVPSVQICYSFVCHESPTGTMVIRDHPDHKIWAPYIDLHPWIGALLHFLCDTKQFRKSQIGAFWSQIWPGWPDLWFCADLWLFHITQMHRNHWSVR